MKKVMATGQYTYSFDSDSVEALTNIVPFIFH